jgi:hypothetical protein
VREPVGEQLSLYAYRVDGWVTGGVAALPADATDPPEPTADVGLTVAATRDGASDSLVARCGRISRVPTLRIAQDPAADELLGRNPLALLLGMLLDQHVRQRSSGG